MANTDSPNYKEQIGNIRNRLEKYATLPENNNYNSGFKFSGIVKKFKPGSILFYVIIPIIITIIVLIVKPSIFKKEEIIENEGKKQTILSFNYKISIISSIITGICINIGLFFYLRKKNNNK